MRRNIRFFLLFFVLSIFIFKTISFSITVIAGMYFNLEPSISAAASQRRRASDKNWIKDGFSEKFQDEVWKDFAAFHKVPPEIKRPKVLLFVGRDEDSYCGLSEACTLGLYSGLTGEVVMYPYRIASFAIRTGFFPEDQTFKKRMSAYSALSEIYLAHEFLHYLHAMNSIPLDKSHLVMYSNQPKAVEFIQFVGRKYGYESASVLFEELRYLESEARKDLKKIK